MNNEKNGLPKMAQYLGYGGLIPFIALAILSISDYQIKELVNISIEHWMAIYGAVILSFLGAIHWGVVISIHDKLTKNQSNTMLVYSIIPSLLAWFSFLFHLRITFFCLAILILVSYMFDYLLLFKQLDIKISKRFSKLRMHLTLVVFVSLFVTAIYLN